MVTKNISEKKSVNKLEGNLVLSKGQTQFWFLPSFMWDGQCLFSIKCVFNRFQCRLGALIGSGEFGEVRRGIWACAAGRVEVAIKMMKREVKEEDKVKFLQEAAIMAQFKHPNVVTMHGMVTAGEPVCLFHI